MIGLYSETGALQKVREVLRSKIDGHELPAEDSPLNCDEFKHRLKKPRCRISLAADF